MDIVDFCTIIISAVSMAISLYSAIVSNSSKIKVSIRFIRDITPYDNFYSKGYSLKPSCYIFLNNLSKQTKYIQSVYIKYQLTRKSKYEATFMITEDIFSIEPQQIIKLPISISEDIFQKNLSYQTPVYAVAIDSFEKKWVSHDFITIGLLYTLYTYTHH